MWSPHGHWEARRRAAATSRRSCCSTASTTPTWTRRCCARARSPTSCTWSTSHGCARRRGASGSRPTFDPPSLPARPRDDLRDPRSATTPTPCVAALLLLGWLASRLGWEPAPLMTRGDNLVGKLAARRQDVQVTLEPTPIGVRGLAGLTIETARGRIAVAGPRRRRAARRARRAQARAARVDDPRRVARRGRESSARASARRCCATPRTGPRWWPRTRSCHR